MEAQGPTLRWVVWSVSTCYKSQQWFYRDPQDLVNHHLSIPPPVNLLENSPLGFSQKLGRSAGFLLFPLHLLSTPCCPNLYYLIFLLHIMSPKHDWTTHCIDEKNEQKSYRFGLTRGWVNHEIIFIFGWTVPLTNAVAFMLATMNDGRSLVVAFALFWVNKSMASVAAEAHMLSENQRQEEAF